MGFLRVRFWQKVLGALLCVGVIPVTLVSLVSIQTTRSDLTSLGVTNIQQRSTSTAGSIDAYLQSRLGDIVLVGKLPDIVRFGLKPSLRLASCCSVVVRNGAYGLRVYGLDSIDRTVNCESRSAAASAVAVDSSR